MSCIHSCSSNSETKIINTNTVENIYFKVNKIIKLKDIKVCKLNSKQINKNCVKNKNSHLDSNSFMNSTNENSILNNSININLSIHYNKS